MPALTTILLGTMAAGALYSADQAHRAGKTAKGQAESAEYLANEQAAAEERNRQQTSMKLQKRRGTAGEPAMRDTILTGPMGLTGQGQQGGKTLLWM